VNQFSLSHRCIAGYVLAPNGWRGQIRGARDFRISCPEKGTGELVCRGAVGASIR